jgi:hypothetical protein
MEWKPNPYFNNRIRQPWTPASYLLFGLVAAPLLVAFGLSTSWAGAAVIAVACVPGLIWRYRHDRG